ncbi:MAG TPA: hypothetical protein VFE19_09425 [Jatrophihabitantaceae bacterium]|nr:hypothetical protein [Jatrophihabitantaceae bacterium]
MGWVVGGVWIGVVVLAAVVLGFCAYELMWKSRRLTADLERLAGVSARLAGLQSELTAAQRRFADSSS